MRPSRPNRTGILGVALDVYHIWWDPELLPQIARAGKDRLMAFHVCDWVVPTTDILNDRGMMGDGVIDIKSIREAVEVGGFRATAKSRFFPILVGPADGSCCRPASRGIYPSFRMYPGIKMCAHTR